MTGGGAPPCLDMASHAALLSQRGASRAPAEGNALPRSMTIASRLAQRFSSMAQQDWDGQRSRSTRRNHRAVYRPISRSSDASSVLGKGAALRDPIAE